VLNDQAVLVLRITDSSDLHLLFHHLNLLRCRFQMVVVHVHLLVIVTSYLVIR
jgi:hypothetical protein